MDISSHGQSAVKKGADTRSALCGPQVEFAGVVNIFGGKTTKLASLSFVVLVGRRLSLKILMKTCFFLRFVAVALLAAFPVALQAQENGLSDSQKEAIKKLVEDLRAKAEGTFLSKNSGAAQEFRAAAASPKAALELYLKCEKLINFDNMNKKESDWREWRDKNKAQYEFEPFVSALQLQLQYLFLATKLNQAGDDLSTVFGELTEFMKALGSLKSPPHPYLNDDISQSVFAEVYELDEVLDSSELWENNPLDVGGIYEKTILPYLRHNLPSNLESAWASRIQQETALAKLFISFEDGMDDYMRRNEGENQAERRHLTQMANFVRDRAKNGYKFQTERLPVLMWGRYGDQFKFGSDKANTVKSMLALIEANLGHDNVKGWLDQVEGITDGAALQTSAED